MRALIVDLNNFSRYPTLPVGLIVAVLRQHEIEVDVLSPLARGVKGYPRLSRAKPFGLLADRLSYWSAVTRSEWVRRLRYHAARALRPVAPRQRDAILSYAREKLASRPDVVLISAYTMHEDTCAALAKLCQAHRVPVLVGGNYFVSAEIVERWLRLDGITAVFGGEPENALPSLISDLVAGRDMRGYRGLSVPGAKASPPAPPLTNLDRLPFPDYRDFPWERYPNRIVPIMTGRGCEWGNCRFCGDVVTSAGRTYRTRSLPNVVDEIRMQRERHATSLFVFLDLKLNSSLTLWRGLIERFPDVAPGAAWTASVHVDSRIDNGLLREDLISARKAGLARITTGLETASPSLLKRMAKGTSPDRVAAFARDATEAGISVRMTAMLGYPGEVAADVDATSRFLEENHRWIERVMLNRFTLMPGTDADRRSLERPNTLPGLRRGVLDPLSAIIDHTNSMLGSRDHRRAAYRLLATVHWINRQPLSARALEFEGVM
jgi:radical SAM superfamily enzyme YgiQ (UPF0313 family)